jgi:hypothetical protein
MGRRGQSFPEQPSYCLSVRHRANNCPRPGLVEIGSRPARDQSRLDAGGDAIEPQNKATPRAAAAASCSASAACCLAAESAGCRRLHSADAARPYTPTQQRYPTSLCGKHRPASPTSLSADCRCVSGARIACVQRRGWRAVDGAQRPSAAGGADPCDNPHWIPGLGQDYPAQPHPLRGPWSQARRHPE